MDGLDVTLQYRYENSFDPEWYDFELGQPRAFVGIDPVLVFREKPTFEPDFYQNRWDPHDIVFWHDEPKGFYADWIRVDVYPHTN